jgi:hypothetical protein
LFREVSSEKCWGQSSTWNCLQRGGRKSFLPNVLSSRGRRPERQFLAYLSVGWCLGIFFAKFRRKSAGGKVAHGFVCKGVGEQAFYQMPCPPEAEGQGQIPCLSLCLSACGLVSRRCSSERFLSTCLCGCPVLSEPRAKDKCLVYLCVCLPVALCPGDFFFEKVLVPLLVKTKKTVL